MDFESLPQLSLLQRQKLALSCGHWTRSSNSEQGTADEERELLYQRADDIETAGAIVCDAVIEVCTRVLLYTIVSTLKMVNIGATGGSQVLVPRATNTGSLVDQLVLTLNSGFGPMIVAAKQQVRDLFHSKAKGVPFHVLKIILARVDGAYSPVERSSEQKKAQLLQTQYDKPVPLDVVRTQFTKSTLADILDEMDSTAVTFCDFILKSDFKSKNGQFNNIYAFLRSSSTGGVINSITAALHSFKNEHRLLEPGLSTTVYQQIKNLCQKVVGHFCIWPEAELIRDSVLSKTMGKDGLVWLNPNMTPSAYDVPPSAYSALANTAAAANLRDNSAVPVNVMFERMGKLSQMNFVSFATREIDNAELVCFLVGTHAQVTFRESAQPVVVESLDSVNNTVTKRTFVTWDPIKQTVTISKPRFFAMLAAFRLFKQTKLETARRISEIETSINKLDYDDYPHTEVHTEKVQHVRTLPLLKATMDEQFGKLTDYCDKTAVDRIKDLLVECFGYDRKNLVDYFSLIDALHNENVEVDVFSELAKLSRSDREAWMKGERDRMNGSNSRDGKKKKCKKVKSRQRRNDDSLASLDAVELAELGMHMPAKSNSNAATPSPHKTVTELDLLRTKFQLVFAELCELAPFLSIGFEETACALAEVAFLVDAIRAETGEDDAAFTLHVGALDRIIPASLLQQSGSYLDAPFPAMSPDEFGSWPLLGKMLLKIFVCDAVDVDIKPDESIKTWLEIANSHEIVDGVPKWVGVSKRVSLATASKTRVALHPFNPAFSDISPFEFPQPFALLSQLIERDPEREQNIHVCLTRKRMESEVLDLGESEDE